MLAGIIFISFIIFFFRSCENDKKEKKESKQEELIPFDKIQRRYVEYDVLFEKFYGDVIYISDGSLFEFRNSNIPYCVSNKVGYEACGQAGQDVSEELGDTNSNTELRFKSQSGENGSITLRVWNK